MTAGGREARSAPRTTDGTRSEEPVSGDPGVVIARLAEFRADPAGAPIRLLLTDPARGGMLGQRARFAAGVEAWARQEAAGIERSWAAEDPELAAVLGDLPAEAEVEAIRRGAGAAVERLSPAGIAQDAGIRARIAAAARADGAIWAGLEADAPGSRAAWEGAEQAGAGAEQAGAGAEQAGAETGAEQAGAEQAGAGLEAEHAVEAGGAGLPATKAEALERHARGRQRVRRLLEGAMAVAEGGAPESRATMLRNSAEWIREGRATLYALSPTHDSATRAPGRVAYFDSRVAWDQPGATYGADSGGIVVKDRGVAGTQGGAAVCLLDPAGRSEAELAETLIHEVQHDADQHDSAGARGIQTGAADDPEVSAYLNLYLSEFNAYWLSGGSSFGSPDAHAYNRWPVRVQSRGADGEIAARAVPTGLQNARQESIFWHLAGGLGHLIYDLSAGPTPAFTASYSYVPWYYVTSEAFRRRVDLTTAPTSLNPANSVRLARLSEAIVAGDLAAFNAAWADLTSGERDTARRNITLDAQAWRVRDASARSAMLVALGGSPQPGVLSDAVTVRRGDTLEGIAARLLGDPDRAGDIYALNRDQLTSPDHIEPGQVLELPR